MIGPRGGADVAIRVHVGHHVVPELAARRSGGGEIDVVDMRPQLGNLLASDRQPEFRFGLGQRTPITSARC